MVDLSQKRKVFEGGLVRLVLQTILLSMILLLLGIAVRIASVKGMAGRYSRTVLYYTKLYVQNQRWGGGRLSQTKEAPHVSLLVDCTSSLSSW